jgi:hypothetical protein
VFAPGRRRHRDRRPCRYPRRRIAKPFLIGPEKGAATSLFLAAVADPTPFHGAYVIGNRIVEPDTAARDDRLGEHLWTESARLVGL